jgi:hypothetical protein
MVKMPTIKLKVHVNADVYLPVEFYAEAGKDPWDYEEMARNLVEDKLRFLFTGWPDCMDFAGSTHSAYIKEPENMYD